MNLQPKERFRIEIGHSYLVDMNPPRKSKPGKVRPVVVIQATDTIESGTPGIVCIPLTSQIMPSNILRVSLKSSTTLKIGRESDVLIDQIHTIDRDLFLEPLGPLPETQFEKIMNGVRFLLNLQ